MKGNESWGVFCGRGIFSYHVSSIGRVKHSLINESPQVIYCARGINLWMFLSCTILNNFVPV